MLRTKNRTESASIPRLDQRGADTEEKRRHPRGWLAIRWLVLCLTLLCVVGLISTSFYWNPIQASLGEKLPRDLIAPFSLRVVNLEKTEKLRAQEDLKFPDLFQYDSLALDRAKGKLGSLMAAVAGAAGQNGGPVTQSAATRAKRLQALDAEIAGLGLLKLPDSTLDTLLRLMKADWFERAANDLLESIYVENGLTRGEYARYKSDVKQGRVRLVETKDKAPDHMTDPERMRVLDIAENLTRHARQKAADAIAEGVPEAHAIRSALGDVVLALAVEPNLRYLPEETRRAREACLAALPPVYDSFETGDLLAAAGTPATQRELSIVAQINRKEFRLRLTQLAGNAILVLLAAWFITFYMRRFLPEMEMSPSNQWLIALPILTALGLGRLALTFIPNEQVAAYLFPAGLVGMLGLILVEARLAMLMVVVSSLLFSLGVDAGLRMDAALVAIFGGMAGIVSLYAMRERKQFIFAGCAVAAANMICIATLAYLENPARHASSEVDEYALVLAGLGNGVVCMGLSLVLPPIFEWLFGVVTDIRLLELTSRHELLTLLEQKAPGTYQHSLNVAKLAEAAADAIGANLLLVRAGTYFHDIGKIVKREYFTENQVTPEETNIHSKLTPNMSTLLIKNHVKEGIELAREHGLPGRVIDFIPQHHGTCLIKYFYQLAFEQFKNSESRDPVNEEDYRYPGPKPQSPETAILMMADSVEATAQSVLSGKTVTTDDIRRLVRDTVNDRFNDGQFEECHLTLRDLHTISESFVQSLRARYHRRVAYKKP